MSKLEDVNISENKNFTEDILIGSGALASSALLGSALDGIIQTKSAREQHKAEYKDWETAQTEQYSKARAERNDLTERYGKDALGRPVFEGHAKQLEALTRADLEWDGMKTQTLADINTARATNVTQLETELKGVSGLSPETSDLAISSYRHMHQIGLDGDADKAQRFKSMEKLVPSAALERRGRMAIATRGIAQDLNFQFSQTAPENGPFREILNHMVIQSYRLAAVPNVDLALERQAHVLRERLNLDGITDTGKPGWNSAWPLFLDANIRVDEKANLVVDLPQLQKSKYFAGTLEELSTRTGLSTSALSATAEKYNYKGVILPEPKFSSTDEWQLKIDKLKQDLSESRKPLTLRGALAGAALGTAGIATSYFLGVWPKFEHKKI